jgi:predicted AlkP superfamily pyrophosphatase or phosphodiesterase
LSAITSILNYYHIESKHDSQKDIDEALKKKYKNIVFMLFDGMGDSILESHKGVTRFLREHKLETLSSVFPSTTTAAIISLESGLSPIEHGWLGWSLYFNEVDANVSVFPNTLSGSQGDQAADYHLGRRHMPYIDVLDQISEVSHGNVYAVRVSPFADIKPSSVNEMCEQVISISQEEKETCIFTYWPQPDFDMHELGTKHEKISVIMKDINNQIEYMCSKLKDTLVIITADHGLIDTKWRFLMDYPELIDCFTRRPSIETRASSFFIKEGFAKEFKLLFNDLFKDEFLLFSKEEILKQKLFGTGVPHERCNDFIGDYVAVAISYYSFEYNRVDENTLFKATHAGLSEEEMNVPLIIIPIK